ALFCLYRQVFPPNIAEATFNQVSTNTIKQVFFTIKIFSNGTHNLTTIRQLVHRAYDQIPGGTFPTPGSSMNVLGLVMFSIVLGAMLSKMGDKGLPLKCFFQALNDVVMRMVTLVMW
ncbi:predicted protein, partial [Nematostella vectensis]